MSRTLSVLILENFLINEGPKWDKFKKGMKKGMRKVGRGAVTAATIGSIAAAGAGGSKISNADKNYRSDKWANQVGHNLKSHEIYDNMIQDTDSIRYDENLTNETKRSLRDIVVKNYHRDLDTNTRDKENKYTQIANKRDDQHAQGKKALVGAAGLGVVPLAAGAHALGAKSEKKKQENKSLKERLNLVKSGMFLNEESADITALRNKISQGLILLPGLKGSAADKMEDAIRSWEDQINKLKNKIGEKYE